MGSRTKNSIRNMMVSLLLHGVSIVLAFVCRTVFAKLLAAEYLGLSGLFSNIISVLALSELGIGSAIIVNLYKPLAEHDNDRICKLMNFYRVAYSIIGTFILVCGLVLSPFIPYLVKNDSDIPNLSVYFLLFIVQSASSYFFSYKQALLTASQKEYICSLVRQFFQLLMNIFQIVFLLITKDYFVYLIIAIITNLGTNIVISMFADRKFPFLAQGKRMKLTSPEKKDLFSKVYSMMLHKIGNTIVNSTDNILISSMISVVITGLYSNYLMIMNIVMQVVNIAINAVSASMGDFVAQKDKQNCSELFNVMRILSYWIFGVCAICFFCLFQPTISLWLGNNYLLEYRIVMIISLNFYLSGIIRIPAEFIDVTGLYTKTKYKSIVMGCVNLVSSIICAKLFGLLGIFVGTLISYLSSAIWIDPFFLYKDFFNTSVVKYFVSLVKNILFAIAVGTVTYFVVGIISSYIAKVLVCGILSNALFFVCYCRTKEIRFVFNRLITFRKTLSKSND